MKILSHFNFTQIKIISPWTWSFQGHSSSQGPEVCPRDASPGKLEFVVNKLQDFKALDEARFSKFVLVDAALEATVGARQEACQVVDIVEQVLMYEYEILRAKWFRLFSFTPG